MEFKTCMINSVRNKTNNDLNEPEEWINMTKEISASGKAIRLFKKVRSEYNLKNIEYIKKNIIQKGNELKEICTQIKRIPYSSESKKLAPVVKHIEEQAVQIKELANELDNPFLLFIMGMGKMGKSTLLNALVGQVVAEENFKPATWKIDVFHGCENEEDEVEIHFTNGDIKRLDKETIQKILNEEENKTKESKQQVNEQFRLKSEKLVTIDEKEDLKKSLENHFLYKSPITEARWPVKSNDLLKNFRIVDTPGLVQNLLGETKLSINEYYHKADGVIWVLDANKISAQKSKELLQELNTYLEEVGGRADNIVAVLNRVDNIRKSHGEEAVQKVCEEAKKIFGDIFCEIIPISALEARKGIENKDEELIEKSGIKHLLWTIDNLFLNKAKDIQIERKSLGCIGVCNALSKDLNKFKLSLLEDEEKRKSIKRIFEEELEQRSKEYKKDLDAIVNKYRETVFYNIDTYTEKLFDFQDTEERKTFIKENIFKPNILVCETTKHMENQNKTLDRLIQYYAQQSTFREFKHLNTEKVFDENQNRLFEYTPNISINGFGVGNISIASGIGISVIGAVLLGPVGIILGGIAERLGFTKFVAVKLKAPKIKQELKDSIEASLLDIKMKHTHKIDDISININNSIEKIREESYAFLYGASEYTPHVLGYIDYINNTSGNEIPKLTSRQIILQHRR